MPSSWSSTPPSFSFFFFNDTATTEIYTLSLHDALPIFPPGVRRPPRQPVAPPAGRVERSEEHTSELQSLAYLVCRLLLEKKKKKPSSLRLQRTNATKPDRQTQYLGSYCLGRVRIIPFAPPLGHLCLLLVFFFFFNDTATTEIYTLSLHDALPI